MEIVLELWTYIPTNVKKQSRKMCCKQGSKGIVYIDVQLTKQRYQTVVIAVEYICMDWNHTLDKVNNLTENESNCRKWRWFHQNIKSDYESSNWSTVLSDRVDPK